MSIASQCRILEVYRSFLIDSFRQNPNQETLKEIRDVEDILPTFLHLDNRRRKSFTPYTPRIN